MSFANDFFNKPTFIALGIIALLIVWFGGDGLFSIVQNRGNLRTGGNVFMETIVTDENWQSLEDYYNDTFDSFYNVYNPYEQGMAHYQSKATVYPGLGWDAITYYGTIVWYVQENKIAGGEIIESGKTGTYIAWHDADKRNIPASYGANIELDLSKYPDGRYKIVSRNLMSYMTDIPDRGVETYYRGIWNSVVNGADTNIGPYEDDPIAWIDYVAQGYSYVINVGKSVEYFEVKREELPDPEEIILEPTCSNVLCSFVEWIKSLFR